MTNPETVEKLCFLIDLLRLQIDALLDRGFKPEHPEFKRIISPLIAQYDKIRKIQKTAL